MRKLLILVCALAVGASMSLAQATGGSPGKSADTGKTTSGKKATKTKKGHKGGKKGKKGSGDTNTGTTNPK
jgi:hypothetical protein